MSERAMRPWRSGCSGLRRLIPTKKDDGQAESRKVGRTLPEGQEGQGQGSGALASCLALCSLPSSGIPPVRYQPASLFANVAMQANVAHAAFQCQCQACQPVCVARVGWAAASGLCTFTMEGHVELLCTRLGSRAQTSSKKLAAKLSRPVGPE